MGMLFARRRNKVEGVTTTKHLLQKEQRKVENVQPKNVKNVPVEPKKEVVETPTIQPKFKI